MCTVDKLITIAETGTETERALAITELRKKVDEGREAQKDLKTIQRILNHKHEALSQEDMVFLEKHLCKRDIKVIEVDKLLT